MEHQPGVLILIFTITSLIVGAASRRLLKRTPIPYSVALLVAGLIFGILERKRFLVGSLSILGDSFKMVSELDPHLILFLFIPALIFESAYNMEVHLFKRTLSQTVTLAVPGLIIATLLTATLAKFVFPWNWSWPACLMFGALISATDPVAVVSLLKEMSSRKRLATLIEGESLLNDGTAIVFFTIFYGMLVFGVSGSIASVLAITAGKFAWVVSLGVFIGLAAGFLTLFWIARAFNDPLFEITLSIAVAYLAYLVAEGGFHVSGIVAVVAVALLFAGRGQTMISPEVKAFLHHFWELLGYLANTLIFLWAGLVIADKVKLADPKIWAMLAVLYIGLQIIRAIAVGALTPFMNKMGIGFSWRKTVTLTWGGLRGAIALALALAVSQDDKIPADLGAQILFLTAGIVVLSILVNGMSMRVVLKYVGYDQLPPEKKAVVDKARKQILGSIRKLIPKLEGSQFLRQVDWAEVKRDAGLGEGSTPAPVEKRAKEKDLALAFRRRLLETERKDYWNQFNRGLLSSDTVRILVDSVEHALDVYPMLYPRPALQNFLRARPFMMKLRNVPLIGPKAEQLSFKQLTTNYEVARGFARAQIHIMGYVRRLSPTKELTKELRNEIILNKRETLLGIAQLWTEHPKMISGIETRVAKRILLNQERIAIANLVETGVLDTAEAEKMVEDVEFRMQRLDKAHFIQKTIEPVPALALHQVKWLTDVPQSLLDKAAQYVIETTYNADQIIMQEGERDHSLIMISKGLVQVIHTRNGVEDIFDILGPGNVVGAVTFLMNRGAAATIKAETAVHTLQLTKKHFNVLLEMEPEMRAIVEATMKEYRKTIKED